MKKFGKAIAMVLHPNGNKGADDPSQAAIQLKPDGTFVLLIGCVDIGNGSVTIMRQIAAETMECPIENVFCSNFSDDFAPLSFGAFASRTTLIDGHAVENACIDLKNKLADWAANKVWNCAVEEIEVADNMVYVKADKENKCLTMKEVGGMAYAPETTLDFLVGLGYWKPAPRPCKHDPETGAMPAFKAIAYGAVYAEVEVDTETGVIDFKKCYQTWDVGKAINPLLVKSQINGGMTHGLGLAATEVMWPEYGMDFVPGNMSDYSMPTFADFPEEAKAAWVEVPCPHGVKGSKGFSEGSTNALGPVLMNAVHDATGVWINQWPMTSEAVLRKLKEAEQA